MFQIQIRFDNGGTYMINFSEGKKWTFLENLDRKLELKLCSK